MSDFDQRSGDSSGPYEFNSYTCPGELYSIPRSIHLARLAAFYTPCRDCEHRFDTGHFVPENGNPSLGTQRRTSRMSIVSGESVRGIYLNELDRNKSVLWGEVLADSLWDQQPMMARREPVASSQIVTDQSQDEPLMIAQGPTVVVGFDERPSSPDIVTGAVLGLRRMGCPVIDLGQTTVPALSFQVQAFDAAAGLYVTGAGCDPSSTGFDLLARRGHPFAHAALEQMEQALKTGVGRRTRKIGGYKPYQGQPAYEASLASHFHALRPLRVVCGTSTRILPRVLDRLFAKLPCKLTHLALPTRRRNLFDVSDIDLQRVAAAVVEGQHHLGVLIDDDGRHVAFVTDRGRLVTCREVARLLIEIAQRENHAAQIVVATSWMNDVAQWLSGRDATVIDGGEAPAELVRILGEREAALALSADGRVWFQHESPACDALLVLAHVLQALSLSDTPFSEVVARISSSPGSNA